MESMIDNFEDIDNSKQVKAAPFSNEEEQTSTSDAVQQKK